MPATLVLVADDEPSNLYYVSASLRQAGYAVVQAADGAAALQEVEGNLLDLILLDIGMPVLDGFEVCQRVREWSQIPIIMLSAKIGEEDKVKALQLGADDYLTKPFGIDELLARVEAVLRRSKAGHRLPDEPTFVSGELQVNLAERRVTLKGQAVELTSTEYDLLRELVLEVGKVLTHRMLLQKVWGAEYGDETEYVRVFINRLRRKLDDDPGNPKYIKTESRVGYRFIRP